MPLHGLPPDPRRGLCPRRAASRRLVRRTAERAAHRARRDTAAQRRQLVRSPGTLADALRLLHDDPEATVVAGSTDWGVEVNLRGARAASVIAIDRLPELRGLVADADRIEIGAALTLTEIERRLEGVPLLAQLFPQFASRLIRNGATLGGNLGTGSPIGDAAPVLLALEASLVLASVDGEREVALSDYYTGYRQSVRRPDELIKAVRVPLPPARLAAFHKIAKRRFDDISSVAIGFALEVEDGVVTRARIGLGGVAATPIRALATEAALEGRPWTLETAQAAADVLRGEGTPIDDHRASAATAPPCSARACSSCTPRTRRRCRHECPVGTTRAPVRRRRDPSRERGPARHRQGALHRRPGGAHQGRAARLAGAGSAGARPGHALRTDPALAVPGVVRVLTAADVPGVNDAGVKHDEPLFPSEVMFYGHAVCWVLGETLEAARLGAAAVEVEVEPLPPTSR